MPNALRVVAAVISHGDRVLACRRNQDKAAGGKWEFPGGKVEAGETDQVALARELSEELGLNNVVVGDLVSRSTSNGSDQSIELACYWVRATRLPVASSDHDSLRWCSVDELSSLDWANADKDAIKELQALGSLTTGSRFDRANS
ncbi:(deoxy)nucleoside triphosphate pyrophosphohydrolase [Brevibacterium casei]|uniref:8-oxo-dGTP diphosphatase n=1 Tax=Brevibacterium casei TaxID=33889 RepID=A0A269ZHJ8_9MICO|nr:(deoxy)nucleoside triphosphate pyrophosphohydrolase [Brevibacterium casei]MCT1552046.1 (deoxy)nucleoside triphosphate pyrophosphohydrolase [Brevibacterium casei]MCT1560428.1 (deoxy)nucleoside triphosphate pyrophosphohydrolase [Brevibacterium casei]MCT2209771.1 (deoxy)nucleoside triphosphate pyrophosphohydrolase [Brevibacterium casei]PAK97264.1 hypothetical protein B8X04_01405 [Brevibacterium casei]QPR39030.1 (deoxy)nucleoside triphosphate pyrophosphohydrolase [Brevibacterium casei]